MPNTELEILLKSTLETSDIAPEQSRENFDGRISTLLGFLQAGTEATPQEYAKAKQLGIEAIARDILSRLVSDHDPVSQPDTVDVSTFEAPEVRGLLHTPHLWLGDFLAQRPTLASNYLALDVVAQKSDERTAVIPREKWFADGKVPAEIDWLGPSILVQIKAIDHFNLSMLLRTASNPRMPGVGKVRILISNDTKLSTSLLISKTNPLSSCAIEVSMDDVRNIRLALSKEEDGI